MSEPEIYSFQRYLAAKKSVDDRALNRQVQDTLLNRLQARLQQPLQVLEIGSGIGTMLERLLTWDLPGGLDYTGIDAQAENIATAWDRLPSKAASLGFKLAGQPAGPVELRRTDRHVQVRFLTSDLFDFAAAVAGQRRWDLQIAHAFLDLMDIPTTLPRLFEMIHPDGLFYYTINFDGVTTFEPEIDPELDDLVERLYHRSMDERITAERPSGDSQAGRHLFGYLHKAGASLLAAGASDWVVFPQAGVYPHDEAYFLHFIIHTLQAALNSRPELDQAQFERWIAKRHIQIERGELIYIAHQMDFIGLPHRED
jgi:hypothetical protein